ncbi:hypothetical protein B0H16DRAFT_1536333 [Mycena metata]|uniref:Uncharacterized protein n=1 Tax=Mycena metata TaxID=1033252 RepID=A0AAD7NF23_9AGAR|nr:hypothetical protein B0H16DRAFT_1536333 [Mycena metata]
MKMPWASTPDAFRRASASWRQMLVMQPPARTLIVEDTFRTPWGTFKRRGKIEFEDGLCMGVLYDFVLPQVDHQGIRFRMRWSGLGDVGTAGELTLTTMDRAGTSPHKSQIDRRFYSKGWQAVDIKVGEWGKLIFS